MKDNLDNIFKIIFLISMLVLRGEINAQNKTTKEDFINSIKIPLVDSSYPFYYMSNISKSIKIEPYDFKHDKFAIERNIIDSVLDELRYNSINDTLNDFWICNIIRHSKCLDKDSARKVVNFQYYVTLKRKWNEKKKNRKIGRQVRKQKLAYDKQPEYTKRVYYFSKPVFTDDGTFAVIKISYNCGSLCGYGCTYLFQKVNEDWKLIAQTNCWVS